MGKFETYIFVLFLRLELQICRRDAR